MSVLVTGATGYIGSKIIDALAEEGEDIVALVRKEPSAHIKSKAKFVFGDVTNVDALRLALKGCNRVFHLAARFNDSGDHLIESVNVDATRSLFQLALEQNARVVFTSTAGTFGPQDGDKLVTEEAKRKVKFFNGYERTKSQAEKVAEEFHKKGLEVVTVNPTRVYGPGIMNEGNISTKIIEKFLQGIWRFIPGDGEAIGNYTYVDDVVTGHLLAMEKGRSGEKYLLGGENISAKAFFDLLKKISRKKVNMIKIDPDAVSVLLKMADIGAKLIQVEPKITPEWVERYTYDWSADSSKAEKELGYKYRSLEVGLKETVRWIKQKRLA